MAKEKTSVAFAVSETDEANLRYDIRSTKALEFIALCVGRIDGHLQELVKAVEALGEKKG